MRTYNLKIGGESFEARIVEYSEAKVVVNLNGDLYEVEIEPEQTPRAPVLVRSTPTRKAEPGAGTAMNGHPGRGHPGHGRPAAAPPADVRPAEGPAAGPAEIPVHASRLSAGMVIAPIPGVVKSIQVKEGDTVQEGDVVLVLEAMKMDNEISCRSSGTVKTIHVKVGDSVQEDQVLIDIEAK